MKKSLDAESLSILSVGSFNEYDELREWYRSDSVSCYFLRVWRESGVNL